MRTMLADFKLALCINENLRQLRWIASLPTTSIQVRLAGANEVVDKGLHHRIGCPLGRLQHTDVEVNLPNRTKPLLRDNYAICPDDVPQNDFLQAKTAFLGRSLESLSARGGDIFWHISRRSKRQESREILGYELSPRWAESSEKESLYLESQRFA